MISRRRRRTGAAALEFALILPVFIAIVFGLADWSWYMYEWMSVDMAVNHGVRLGAGEKTSPEAVALAGVKADLTARRIHWASTNLTATKVLASGKYTVKVVASIPFSAPFGLVPTPPSLACTASVAWYGNDVSP